MPWVIFPPTKRLPVIVLQVHSYREMTSPTFSLTDISIRGRQTNSQVIVSGVPSRRKKKVRTPDRRLDIMLPCAFELRLIILLMHCRLNGKSFCSYTLRFLPKPISYFLLNTQLYFLANITITLNLRNTATHLHIHSLWGRVKKKECY